MNDVPRRKYNRVLFSRVIKLPEGLPGEGNDELGFVYNIGRIKGWDHEREEIIGSNDDKLIDAVIELQQARENYNAEWTGQPRSAESLRAAAFLARLERTLDLAGYRINQESDRLAAAYLIERVEHPYGDTLMPQGDKPETWKLLDPAIVHWLVEAATLRGVLEELDGPLAMRPSMPLLDYSEEPPEQPSTTEEEEDQGGLLLTTEDLLLPSQ